jgi:hypothetical protein
VGIIQKPKLSILVAKQHCLMERKKLKPGDWIFVLANLLPVYGVWFLGWHPVEAFIVYAMETLIAGIITILKMLVVTFARGGDEWPANGTSTKQHGVVFILFFIAHFGLFAMVQTTIFSETANITPPGSGFFHFFFHWPSYVTREISYMLGAFTISYMAQYFFPFLLNGEYKTKPLMYIMFEPYGRIFIQQITVILGSMFLTLGLGKAFILVFAGAKIWFDLFVDFSGILNKAMKDVKKDSPKE